MELSGKLKLGGLAKSKRNRKQRQNHLRLKLNHFWGRGNFCGKKKQRLVSSVFRAGAGGVET